MRRFLTGAKPSRLPLNEGRSAKRRRRHSESFGKNRILATEKKGVALSPPPGLSFAWPT